MNNEMISWLLLVAALIGFGAGAAWQFLRRKPVVRRVERVGSRPVNVVPSEMQEAVQTEPLRPRYGVIRPSMLAITAVRGDPTAAEVFVQRAFLVDEPHYRALPIEPNELKAVQCLFEHNAVLDWSAQCEFSHDIYAINFSPVIVSALSAGHHPRVNATAADLQIVALGEGGVEIGEPMATPDYSWGATARIQALWELLNPADKKHELDEELQNELDAICTAIPRVKANVSAVRAMVWDHRWEELFDLVRDVRRLGAEEGRALERRQRADEIAGHMRRFNQLMDENLVGIPKSIRTLKDADVALKSCVALMLERELSVLFLRAIAIIRVIGGDDYAAGMRCANHIESNVRRFPDVHLILDAARHLALQALANNAHALHDKEMALAGEVQKEADQLALVHDEALARLKVDIERLQSAMDKYLILQGRPRRFAVRMAPDNSVAALLVLGR